MAERAFSGDSGHLVTLAKAHNELSGFSPRFFERHSTKTVQRLVDSNPDHYGWLTNCVVVDSTDELIEVPRSGHSSPLRTRT